MHKFLDLFCKYIKMFIFLFIQKVNLIGQKSEPINHTYFLYVFLYTDVDPKIEVWSGTRC